jgi:SulP family sulfate permease
MGVGLSSLLIMILMKLWKPTRKVPGPLVMVILGMAVTAIFSLDEHVETIGEVPNELPSPTFVDISSNRVGKVVTDAFFIAIIGFLESISISKRYSTMPSSDYRVVANQEMYALGVTNIVG